MRKGQAAMDFIVTYGWALLLGILVLVAIAFQFNLFNARQFLPPECVLFPGMHCVDFKADATQDAIYIQIENNLGIDAMNVSFNVSGDCTIVASSAECMLIDMGPTNLCDNTTQKMRDGESCHIYCPCIEDILVGEPLIIDVSLGYYKKHTPLLHHKTVKQKTYGEK